MPLPEHTKDTPFKGLCPFGEILQVDEVIYKKYVTNFLVPDSDTLNRSLSMSLNSVATPYLLGIPGVLSTAPILWSPG